MSNRKVVEIDERIPTLKERRRQRTNRRVIVYVSSFFILMTIVMYFQTSFSHVKKVEVTGNQYVDTEWIIQKAALIPDVSMWRIQEEKIKENISENPEISSVSIMRKWPNTVLLEVDEYERVAYISESSSFYPLLETGVVLTSTNKEVSSPFDAPILSSFYGEEERTQLANELAIVPVSLRQLISEIHHSPVESDPLRIFLYMNDGFVVSSTIRRFSERITPYPSVVTQLDPEVEGIVHMRMNPYFERFDIEEEEEGESEG
ncbi:cell division protein FtsQ/DivIB [Evansella tamaricis]|uniref:Cell division protein DivIB n=1 Tax=Evansella tamaricis TaxID=2069301 RepID=A0ABS6JFJ1_9BACI|nr:FtsQ-type POTRA domain-containing protein [Evansella tamaricis]MBU9712424.1 FtsQ-type POTRA domain-containing protein [Evansella tamaricis]